MLPRLPTAQAQQSNLAPTARRESFLVAEHAGYSPGRAEAGARWPPRLAMATLGEVLGVGAHRGRSPAQPQGFTDEYESNT